MSRLLNSLLEKFIFKSNEILYVFKTLTKETKLNIFRI